MKSRLLLIAAGAIVSLLLLAGVAISLPSRTEAAHTRRHHRHCLTYFLIPWIQVCGKNVYYKTHGHRQWIGKTKDLHPMPKPPADRRR